MTDDLATIDADVERTKQLLERTLPGLKEFRKAGLVVVWDILNKFLSGELQYRNADEAMKVAKQLMELMNGAQLQQLGEEIDKVPVEDQKAVLAALTAEAISRQIT